MLYTPHEDLIRYSECTVTDGVIRSREPFSLDTMSEYGRILHSMSFRRLQGKIQLFPPSESPLMRNRLTHSMEVADIAAKITGTLNRTYKTQGTKIDVSLVTAASLAHDIGHPPFGHAGEKILARKMSGFGSFEGNAQTLRIITRLENRLIGGSHFQDIDRTYRNPLGLDLLLRTVAATLKYNTMIPSDAEGVQPIKGFYEEDSRVVGFVSKHVFGDVGNNDSKRRTLECQIMDIADDIAYSTRDFEDCMIAGITSPIDLMSVDDLTANKICKSLNKTLASFGYKHKVDEAELRSIYWYLFRKMIIFSKDSGYDPNNTIDKTLYVAATYQESRFIAENPMKRRLLVEQLTRQFIQSISVNWNSQDPRFSKLEIDLECLLIMEALKHYNYEKVILSPRLQWYNKYAENVISTIFDTMVNDIGRGDSVLIPDYIKRYYRCYMQAEESNVFADTRGYRTRRFACDFISSLTDAEAVEIYRRITSPDQRTIFAN